MLMNRIGPSSSELYVANADGSGERKFLESGAFEYHPPWSSDGNWLVFTSRVMGMVSPTSFAAVPTGPALNRWSPGPSMDDAGVLSPDGSHLAFVSTLLRDSLWEDSMPLYIPAKFL